MKTKPKPTPKSLSAASGFAAVFAALSSGERARSHRRVLSPDVVVVVVVLTINCCAGRGKKKLQSWCRELCTRRPPCVRQLRCDTKRRGRRSSPVPDPATI